MKDCALPVSTSQLLSSLLLVVCIHNSPCWWFLFTFVFFGNSCENQWLYKLYGAPIFHHFSDVTCAFWVDGFCFYFLFLQDCLIVVCCVLFLHLLVVASCSVDVSCCNCSLGCFFLCFVFLIFSVAFLIGKLFRIVLFSCRCCILYFWQGSCPDVLWRIFTRISNSLGFCYCLVRWVRSSCCCLLTCFCIRLIPDHWGFCAWVLLMRCWFSWPLSLVIA